MSEDATVTGPGRTDPLRLVLGSLVAASRRIDQRAGPADPPAVTGGEAVAEVEAAGREAALDLRYVALGAVCAMEDGALAMARAGTGMALLVSRPLAAVTQPFIPRALRREIAARLEALDRYGRTVTATGSGEAVEVVEGIAGEVVADPFFAQMIEQIVWRVVDRVLPVVLDRLAAEPDQIRALVHSQSMTIAEELVQEVQTRAADGDAVVDRFFDRLLHRRQRADGNGSQPRPAPTTIPAVEIVP